MTKLGNLLKDIEVVSKEEALNDMSNNSGSSFITEGGVYPTTIINAFMTETKKGGVQLDLHFGGANSINVRLYIVSVKNGKRVTTCTVQGKTVSLPDFKLLKQLYFVATGEAKDLSEIETKVETIKFKEYGKDVEVDGEVLVDLIGKEVNIAIRLEEEYNYEDGETDKTSLKVDGNGDVRYKKNLDDVYSIDGLSALEIVKKEEPKAMKAKEAFLASDKAIKRVKLEMPEEDSSTDIEDDNDDI